MRLNRFYLVAWGVLISTAPGVGKDITVDKPKVLYHYSREDRGPQHFCDFSTTLSAFPLILKLTAAFISDDSKPADRQMTVGYILEGYTASGDDQNLSASPIPILAGRIVSDIFDTDLYAKKTGAGNSSPTYIMPTEASLALFTSVITMGKFDLIVKFANRHNMLVKVMPNPDIFDPGQAWLECSMEIAGKHSQK